MKLFDAAPALLLMIRTLPLHMPPHRERQRVRRPHRRRDQQCSNAPASKDVRRHGLGWVLLSVSLVLLYSTNEYASQLNILCCLPLFLSLARILSLFLSLSLSLSTARRGGPDACVCAHKRQGRDVHTHADVRERDRRKAGGEERGRV